MCGSTIEKQICADVLKLYGGDFISGYPVAESTSHVPRLCANLVLHFGGFQTLSSFLLFISVPDDP